MERVVLLRYAGASMTTMAHHLAAVLDPPVAHLDELRYDPGWNETEPAVFAAAERNLLGQRRLVCDGNYLSTLSEHLSWADTVIWHDYGLIRYLWRVLARYRWHGPGQHGSGVFVRITWPF
ncbi:P-loop NTPase family protein [Glycomyces xiaoerkulensis]|uniref:topology modulation protein n=1 Tax=Glycomyces xiaoerkulensis TaxID=2038139 RepID=UPI001300160C|nr:topology modulation protein [Glycomyces xiaoerkulensis]